MKKIEWQQNERNFEWTIQRQQNWTGRHKTLLWVNLGVWNYDLEF